ncbi:MAG: glycerol-3-phosphate dehydrogenase subunit GlpB [Desulfatibacillaceae bacterium]
MNLDVLIAGGGIAGLTCGIACARSGLETAVVSSGMSALHFSSGCIDLLGHHPGRRVVTSPFQALEDFIALHPRHPYAACGVETVRRALGFFQEEMAAQGHSMNDNGDLNHFHLTALGTVKPTYFSPVGMYDSRVEEAFQRRQKVALLTFAGFRDFYPELAAANLARHPLFADCEITTGSVRLAAFDGSERNPGEFRSIDMARLFDADNHIEDVARQINRLARGADFAVLPAFLGINDYAAAHARLQEMCAPVVYEVPTLPPSLIGMRLEAALKARFAKVGGIFIAGDKVVRGRLASGRVSHVLTRANRTEPVCAKTCVLATGSFFSGGISSEFNRMHEPVFGLQMDYDLPRKQWYADRFLSPRGHPYMAYGVRVDNELRPTGPDGETVENLFCAGAVLSGYNPVQEGSGSGVAIATGYHAAGQAIRTCGAGNQTP